MANFEQMSWAEIAQTVREQGATAFNVGDRKTFKLKDGEEYVVQVCDRKNGLVLAFYDALDESRRMNPDNTNEGGFKASELYGWLNGKFKNNLPDDLKEAVKEVFLPEKDQVFGGKDAEQFELYAMDWKQRVAGKRNDKSGWWWWLATPYSASSFCYVDFYGNSYFFYASVANIYVRPHFLLA